MSRLTAADLSALSFGKFDHFEGWFSKFSGPVQFLGVCKSTINNEKNP